MVKELPPGAVRIHLTRNENVLRGRGPVEKESLSLAIFERMQSCYEHWTNPIYGDNPSPNITRQRLIDNARAEVEVAIAKFVRRYGDGTLRSPDDDR
jgi:hypothetical protein